MLSWSFIEGGSWNAPVLQAPLAENVTQDCGAHPPDGICRVCILSHSLPFGGTIPCITFLELFCESTMEFMYYLEQNLDLWMLNTEGCGS